MAKAARRQKITDPSRPVAVWSSKDLLDGKPVRSLTVILRTVGCRWRRCTMCGYASEGAPATAKDLLDQFELATKRLSSEDRVVKIYTSGSFLDPLEMPVEARTEILEILKNLGIEKLVIETRPEYVSPKSVEECVSRIRTEFAIGLETSNDLIRHEIIHKGFTFKEFVDAAKTVHDHGGTVKAYLLLKPPFLSEGAAIRDAISSAKAASKHSDILSLNLSNIQRGTPMERLWERGGYRPPWLWSAVEALKNVDSTVICDPVGAGSARGPSNCGECDAAVADAIQNYNLTQDKDLLNEVDCRCKAAWRRIVELEEHAFGTPLV